MHCDVRRGVGAQVMRAVDYALFAVQKFETLSIILWYNALYLWSYRPCFPHMFHHTQSLHEFLSQPQCALSIATFISEVLEHRELPLTFTCIIWNVIILVKYDNVQVCRTYTDTCEKKARLLWKCACACKTWAGSPGTWTRDYGIVLRFWFPNDCNMSFWMHSFFMWFMFNSKHVDEYVKLFVHGNKKEAKGHKCFN